VAQNINIKDYAIKSAYAAITASLERRGITGVTVESIEACKSMYRIHYPIVKNDLVSIIIPTKNHASDLKKCLNSIFEKTTYPNYEIVIVDNGSDEEDLFAYYEELKKHPNVTLCSLDIPFNYSRINNYAISKAKGDYYLLLNNDIEIITPNWIEEMLMYVQRDDVGAAGAMLYYPDDTVQHAGVILGFGGIAEHAHKNIPRGAPGYMGRATLIQNMSAVTAASMMVKTSVFNEINGFEEKLAVAFNDVDLCMKIREAGYLIVFTPYAEAYHHESKSRGSDDTPEKKARFEGEIKTFEKRWGALLSKGDPYYNPNFVLHGESYQLRPFEDSGL
jgi:GT2 family glycosyltransferase